jgi:predicted dehydrogenase
MKTIVLGVGRMGRRHIQVIREMGLDLVGICDPNQESLLLAQKEQAVPVELHYTNARALISEKKPECVVIASTAPSHREYVDLAATLGAKYILCEKPMSTSLADCDAMINTCKKHGTRLAVNHQMRFMEQYIEPKKYMLSEKLGGISSITVVAGNFGIAMNGSHYFEMFRYMTDEAPKYVSAWFSEGKVPNPRGAEFEDHAGSIRIVSSSGKRFYLETSADQGHGIQVIYAAKFGQIIVDELAGKIRMLFREDQYRDLPTTRYGMPAIISEINIKPADAVAPSRAVLESLISGVNTPTGEDGRLAVAALVAAYVSNENNHGSVEVEDMSAYRQRVFPWA